MGAVGRGILCREDNLIAHAANFHPLAEPLFGFFGLVVVCSFYFVSDGLVGNIEYSSLIGLVLYIRIDEVASVLVVCV